MRLTFGKEEKLKSRKLIQRLFEEGKSLKKFPVRLVFLQTNHTSSFPIQASFSVPKRNFKKAVDRNRIKRLMREAYRLQKNEIYKTLQEPYIFMITFIGTDEPTFSEVDQKIRKVLSLFIQEIKNQEDEKIQD